MERRYEVKTIQFTTKQESDLYRELQSERAARIAAETKLAELEDANQKLRELYYTERKDLAQFREYADTYYPDLWDCFENSRARSKS